MNASIDISNIVLRTERLVLRPWRRSDLDDFFEYASVPGVGEMAGWGHHRSISDTEAVLERFISGKKTFALEYRGSEIYLDSRNWSGKVIGSLGIEKYDEARYPDLSDLRCRELGFVLSKDYWGLGLMPEAAAEVLRYLFTELQLDAVTCGHFLWNTQSLRVQEKCGFRHYKFDEYATQTGRIEEHECRLITRQEWFADENLRHSVSENGGRR